MSAVSLAGEISVRPPRQDIERLKKRADFQAASKGRRFHTPLFTLQSVERRSAGTPDDAARVGLTVTRKTGNAVVRNRIRRRLREALRAPCDLSAAASHDYVIVARRDLLGVEFTRLKTELASAFRKIHAPRPKREAGSK